MKTLTIVLAIAVLTFCGTLTYAQPQYKFSGNDGNATPSISTYGGFFRQQGLYTRSDFPSMPAGRVKAVYFRVGAPYTHSGSIQHCRLDNVTLKIGYVADTVYRANDTFRTGLTTIYGPDTFSVPCAVTVGQWIRIPAAKGAWHYRTEGAKFAVELSCGPQSNPNINFHATATTLYQPNRPRTIYTPNAVTSSTGTIGNAAIDLGFDLGQPAEIASLSRIESFGLFPNPSTDGLVNISLEAAEPLREASVRVVNVTGLEVYGRQLPAAGTRIFEALRLGDLPKGNYFVQVIANGEPISRRLVLQ